MCCVSISGFTILGGVEWHSSGVLKERLKEMLSADQFQLSPDVLATIVSDWIDAVVRLFFLPIGVLLGVGMLRWRYTQKRDSIENP